MPTQVRDLLQLFLLPFLAACLPWPLGFRLLRRLARARWIFPQETAAALTGVRLFATPQDEANWCWRHRLQRLVDHTDLYLSLLRTNRWMTRQVEVVGQWPQQAPFLAAFFHWGAGLWGLRHLSQAGQSAVFLSVQFDRQMFRTLPLRYWYARLRAWQTARAAGRPILYTGKAATQLRQLYTSGSNVVAALDVPPGATRGRLDCTLFGRPAALARGVIRTAVESGVPIVLFAMGLDYTTGRRRLVIAEPFQGTDEVEAARHFAAALEATITADSPGWHLWGDAQSFFAAPQASAESPREDRVGLV